MVCVGNKFKAVSDQAKTMRKYHQVLVKACARDKKLLAALTEMGSRDGVETVQQRLQ